MRLTASQAYLPVLLLCLPLSAGGAEFSSDWAGLNRPWVGPQYWAGPLQDWRLANDRLECFVSGANRLVFLTTHDVASDGKGFETQVRIGALDGKRAAKEAGWVGMRIGIRGTLPDYRNAALFGRGVDVGIRLNGTPFIGQQPFETKIPVDDVSQLALSVVDQQATLTITTRDRQRHTFETTLTKQRTTGHVALVCHREATGKPGRRGNATARGGNVRFWFRDWRLAGDRVAAHPERAWGPILWTQYTLSKGVLKLNAQLAPLGKSGPKQVVLRYQGKSTHATVDPLSRTATFRVTDWDATQDTPYEVQIAGLPQRWKGTIRKDPVDQRTIVVAGFTGNTDYIFPDTTLITNVTKHNPDVLFFSGDQLYESVGGYGIQRTWSTPVETVALDYLRKWYLLGWAWKDLLKDRPSLFFPDDHDVYQGNIWGAGGRASKQRGGFDDGGYGMHATWVNAVQRTQTAHMPDPYDATPVQQGITVYYGDMNYGRISFAMIEDRKFKTGPATALPNKPGRADHIRREDVDEKTWDPKSIDVPGTVLLGQRQLKFLDAWAADWKQTDFKVVLSQTIFCNLANYHGANKQYLIADLDSNGWPQTGRNKAVESMRRGFAFHYAGDQHLPSIVHHGVTTWNDAGYSFCVPSISAGYPRSWIPDNEGRPVRNRPAPGLPNTGEYRDGLGNYVTVYAIGNPEKQNRNTSPETLGHDKASGYGIVRFDKQKREITIECWRLLVDVSNPQPGDQFPGWPKTIALEDNYGRQATAHLPTIEVAGMQRPVVQVINEATGEIVYTLRVGSNTFRPKVFADAPHTLIIGEPAEGKIKKLTGISPTSGKEVLQVDLRP